MSENQRLLNKTGDAEKPLIPKEQPKINWKPLYKLLIYWFLYRFSNVVVAILPGIKKDYFGGSDKTAAMYQSILDCSVALMGLFTASINGKLLDSIGRRPFFLFGSFWNMCGLVLLLIFFDHILVYMLFSAVLMLLQSSYLFTTITDLYPASVRMKAFSAVQAVGAGTALTMIIVALVSRTGVILVALFFGALAFIYALFVLPETLAPDLVKPMSLKSLENPFASMKELVRSKVVLGVVAIFGFFLIAQVGTGEIYMFYLNDRIGFNDTDNAIAFAIVGVMSPIVQLVLLPWVSKRLSSVMIILMCLVFQLGELVLIGTAFAKWPMFFFAVPLVVLTGMVPPTVMTILANTGTDEDQGRRMAGMSAVSDLCQAIGPLFFGQLYAHSPGGWVILPFLLSALFVFPCAFLTLRIEKWVEEARSSRRMSRMRSRAPEHQDPPKETKPASVGIPPKDTKSAPNGEIQ